MSTAVMTSKGQVTVPKEIREKYRLKPGAKLQFLAHGRSRIVVIPKTLSIRDVVPIVAKPRRAVSQREIDDAVAEAAVARYEKSLRR
jgi:AbrB family looped-hinge helix DNA binding protein